MNTFFLDAGATWRSSRGMWGRIDHVVAPAGDLHRFSRCRTIPEVDLTCGAQPDHVVLAVDYAPAVNDSAPAPHKKLRVDKTKLGDPELQDKFQEYSILVLFFEVRVQFSFLFDLGCPFWIIFAIMGVNLAPIFEPGGRLGSLSAFFIDLGTRFGSFRPSRGPFGTHCGAWRALWRPFGGPLEGKKRLPKGLPKPRRYRRNL